MNQDEVAFHGIVALYDVKSSLRGGIQLVLQLMQEEEYHPFKEMRKSTKKLTVIYELFWKIPGSEEWFKEEVWFMGYNVTNTAGAKVRFELQDDDAFQRFMTLPVDTDLKIVMRELDDDHEAVNQANRKRMERAVKKGGARCRETAILCNNETFQRFANIRGAVEQTQEGAAEYVRKIVGIDSRRDLDYDDAAWDRFNLLVRKPFNAWPGRNVDHH